MFDVCGIGVCTLSLLEAWYIYLLRCVIFVMYDNCRVLQVNDHTKAKITERIEPWIRRELQAVLGDPDPLIIVHFASALFIKRLARENNRQSEQTGMLVEDEVSSLRKFLYDKEDIFWHELR